MSKPGDLQHGPVITYAGLAALAYEDGLDIAAWMEVIRDGQLRPALCNDCGVNTSPGEWYVVWPDVWDAAGMHATAPYTGGGFLCIACLENRLGRPLRARDFSDAPVNEPDVLDTPRLAAAKRRRS